MIDRMKSYFLAVSMTSLLYFGASQSVHASPYIEVGDSHIRHSIQLLADAGYLHGPMNTFPMSWAPIVRDIYRIDVSKLTAVEMQAYTRIVSALEYAQQPGYRAIRLQGSTSREGEKTLSDFNHSVHERGSLQFAQEIQGEHVAVRIQTRWRAKPEEQGEVGAQNVRFDGSYIAAVIGNWGVSLDQLDNWWGPGETQALLQSNHALALPVIRATRLGNEPFKLPGLKHLGYWSATAYVGLSEHAGGLGHHEVLGARFSFQPSRYIEIGAGYVGHRGGKNPIDRFFNPVDTSKLRNQHVSVDARLSGLGPFGVYGEYTQVQRRNSPSAQRLGMDYFWNTFGRSFSKQEALNKTFLEVTRLGLIYDNWDDPAGFRRWGSSVGAGFDQDASGFTLGYSRYQAEGQGLEVRLGQFKLKARNALLRERYAGTLVDTADRRFIRVMWQQPLGYTLLKVGVEHWDDSVKEPLTADAAFNSTLNSVKAGSETSLWASLEYRW